MQSTEIPTRDVIHEHVLQSPNNYDTSVATLAKLWDRTTVKHAGRPFLIFSSTSGETREWTYRAFNDVVEATENRLRSFGIGHGDGIHLCLRNCPSFIAIWLAAARIGAWINPVDPTTSQIELADQFARTSVSLGVCSADRGLDYRTAASRSNLSVLELPDNPADMEWLQVQNYQQATDEVAAAERPKAQDRLAVMFTSGTTSRPKGVVLTQRNYRVVAEEMAKAAHLGREDRWLVTLPLFHGNAQYYCFCSAIEVGASVALTEHFSASRWVQQAIDLGATSASLFAAPIRMILARTPEDQTPAALRHVWFAQNLGEQHHSDFGALTGVAPRQLYGMTETIAVVTTDTADSPRSNVIGRALNHRQVQLRDPVSLQPVPLGTPGVITVAGTPGLDLFLEYLDAPEITEKTLITDDHGQTWLVTGDLATDDGNGELTFVGRSDDVIKVAGENVSLAELEAAIAEAPGVLEAAALAEPDPIRDRVPVAYVVPKPDQSLDVADLKRWANSRLTKAARPSQWHIIDELPRTSVGKIRRFKLTPTTNSTGGQ